MAGALGTGGVPSVPGGNGLSKGMFGEVLVAVNLAIGGVRGMKAPGGGDDLGGPEVPAEGMASGEEA